MMATILPWNIILTKAHVFLVLLPNNFILNSIIMHQFSCIDRRGELQQEYPLTPSAPLLSLLVGSKLTILDFLLPKQEVTQPEGI